MANYPKELIDLTQEYLTDGVITPKERQVLLNKAVMLNVDPNEFDLYIDAQLQKMEQIAHEAAQKQKGRLCPYCQEPLPMFDDRCPGCGKNITPEASKEVEELIDVLETALVSFKAVAEKKKNSAKMSYPATPAMQFKTFSNMFTGKEDRENEKTDISYATTKAEVERYIRKAKMYYGSNKTVNFLVSEVELAVAEAEKSVASAKAKKETSSLLL